MATNNNSTVTVRSAARKKQQFRDTRLGVLPNTIDAFSRLTVDAATKAALVSAGAKLTIEIDTAGTRVFLAEQRTGQLLGGPEDLQRLGGIRSFVSRERKDAQGVEIAREVTQLAFKATKELHLISPEYVQPPLEASYGAAVRPLLTIVHRIDDNKSKLLANTNPNNRNVFEEFLTNMFTKVRNAYFHLILAHTKGENTKGRLNDLLFERGVPEYVHSRLTNQGLVLDRGQELARVLFPSDPSKGLALTLKEWRDSTFREKLGAGILGGSHLVVRLVNDHKFLRAITKIDSSIDLDDETNPSIAKLLKCRVAVMPPMMESRYVTEPASKSKAGWKFPSPSMDSIQGSINALSTALMRLYSANMQSVDLIGDFYATIVPGAVTRAAVSPTNNFYVQWSNAADPTKVWADHIRGGGYGVHRENVWRWLRTEMRLSEKAEGGKALATALYLSDTGKFREDFVLKEKRIVKKTDPNDPDKETEIEKEYIVGYKLLTAPANRSRAYSISPKEEKLTLIGDPSPSEIPLWKEYQKATFPARKKQGKNKRAVLGNTLTKLSPEGLALCEEIENLSSHLADRMRVWLRGFSDTRIQRAAVKLAFASFDELFIEESKDSDEESDADASDDDE